MQQKRKRATIIVETDNGILLVSHSRRAKPTYMLPGGGLKKGESSIDGAKRELYEETGLSTSKMEFLFGMETRNYEHRVFLAESYGRLRKRHEITHIRFYNKSTKDRYKLAWHVKPIIGKYHKMKDRGIVGED